AAPPPLPLSPAMRHSSGTRSAPLAMTSSAVPLSAGFPIHWARELRRPSLPFRRSARLAVPPSFPPRLSSPPLWLVDVDSGASGGGDIGGADLGVAGSWGAASPTDAGGAGGAAGGAGAGGAGAGVLVGGVGRARAAGSGGAGPGGASADVPGVRCVGGTGAGGTGTTGCTGGAVAVGAAAGSPGSRRQESLSPERLREWAVHWGSPGGGAGRAGAAGSGGAGRGGAGVGVPRVVHAGGTGGAGPVAASGGGTGGVDTGGATGGTGGAYTGGVTGGTGVGGASRQESLSSWGPSGGAGGAGSWSAVCTGTRGCGGVTTKPQQSALRHLLSLLPAGTKFPVAGTTPSLLFPPTDQSQPQLLPSSPLPAPAPHTKVTEFFFESREPESREPETHLVRTANPTVTRLLATVVTGPSFESAAVSALVAELVDFAPLCRLDYDASLVFYSSCPPSVGGELALGCDVLEDRQFELECLAAAAPHLASSLLCPEGDPDALDIPTPRTYAEAITGPYSSQWQIAMDVEMASWKSTGTYVDKVSQPGVNIVDGIWIFRVKRPPGSPPSFKARYIARGFSQHEGVDFFQTFSPTPKMTTLQVLLHVAAQRDYELHSLDFSTPFLQGSLHEAIWLRRPRGFSGSFAEGTQWSLRRPVYGLRQAPRGWHDTLRNTLAALGFAPSSVHPSLFLRTDTSLLLFYVLLYVDDLEFAIADTEALALLKAEIQERHTCTDLGELRSYLGLQINQDRARRTITLTQSHMVQQVLQHFHFSWSSPQSTPLSTVHSLSAPPSDESIEPNGLYLELVGCLMYLMTCTRPDLAYSLSLLARYVAPGRHRKVHWDAAKRVLCYLCSTLGVGLLLGGEGSVVLTRHSGASRADEQTTHRSTQGCEADIYAGAMAAQELRWLTYLLTDLWERPRFPPVLYQRGQLRLAYVATQANTANVVTNALGSSDHQRFCTALELVPTLPHLLVS
ncbi:unnamed protein product, partial [Closterium sp. NIES-53]